MASFNVIIILMNFQIYFSPTHSQAILSPSMNVVAASTQTTFNCFIGGGQELATGVTWFINSSQLEELNLNGVTPLFSEVSGVATLRIVNVSTDLNSTTVQCVLRTSSSIPSNNAILLIQGTLDRVSNISATIQYQSVTIMWEAPFTLDLTIGDPGITYCVDVMDYLNNTLYYSQCGIDTTSVTIPLDTDLCIIYTITPVNPAGNGSVATDLLNVSSSNFCAQTTATATTAETTAGFTTTIRIVYTTTEDSGPPSTVFQISLASAVVFIIGLVIGCVVGVIFHHICMHKIKKCPRAEEGSCEKSMPVYEDVSLHKTTPVIQMEENVAYSLK